MCLIALRRNKDETLHRKYFDTAANRNQDGIGIMYVKDNKVVVKKLDGKAPDKDKLLLYKEFRDAPTPSALHLRLGTAGNKADLENAHPFQILSKEEDGIDLWMMHNGHFSVTTVDSTKSDTWHFANMYIKKLVKKNPYILCDPFVKHMISKFTNGNRIVFMYGCGSVVVIEDSSSHSDSEYGGCWLSNRSMVQCSSYSHFRRGASDNVDDYDEDSMYGTTYLNRSKLPDYVTKATKEKEDMKPKEITQEKLELEKAEEETPAKFELPETIDEQFSMLGGMDDDALLNFVADNPEDVVRLLGNFRDYYLYTAFSGSAVAAA